MIPISELVKLSARRLRLAPARVALTVVGIAAGVALIAAVGALNASLTSGYRDFDIALFGDANLQALARSPVGVNEAVARRVQREPFVRWSAALTSSSVTLAQADRHVDVQLTGVDGEIAARLGIATPSSTTVGGQRQPGVVLPAAVAAQLSARVGTRLWVMAGGLQRTTTVARVLSAGVPAVLTRAPVALAALPLAQQLTARTGVVDELVIRANGQPGAAAALQRILSPGMLVRRPGDETALVSQATQLDRLGVRLFGAICLIVGGLLAMCATALSTGSRRREAAMLFAIGGSRSAVVAEFVAEGVLLGAAGALLGLIGGVLVFDHVLASDGEYLSSAFIIVRGAGLPARIAAASAAIGVLTGIVACLLPARSVLSASPALALRMSGTSAVLPWRPSRRLVLAWLLVPSAVGVAALTTVIPGILAVVGVLLSGLVLLPLAVPVSVALFRRCADRVPPSLHLGISELVDNVPRATAMAAVAGITICGIVLAGGMVRDIENGATKLASADFGEADLWISDASPSNAFLTRPIDAGFERTVAHTAGVAGVIPFDATFFDWAERRLLVIGFRGGFSPSELVTGSAATASAEVASGGAVALSQSLADRFGVGVGQRLTLATPTGSRRVTVAATTTNYGWTPGVISLNLGRFQRWWGLRQPTALGVVSVNGTLVGALAAGLRHVLRAPGVAVSTPAQVRNRIAESARQGLQNLRRLSLLVALAGLVTICAVALAAMLQRLQRIAVLRAIGAGADVLGTAAAFEIVWCVTIGAVLGAATGLVGERVAVRYLANATGLPMQFAAHPQAVAAAAAVALAIAAAAALLALRVVVRAPPAASLRRA